MRHTRTAPDQTAATLTRRNVLRTLGTAGSLLLAPQLLKAQEGAPRDFSPGAAPLPYPDPDVIAIDRSFNALRQFNAPIQRLYTGALWSEGPAWSSQGRYLVWSDIPNNRQLRWLEDDGRVTVFRAPSNNSNGNAFDFQGRQISCEHLTRRVVRYELDGKPFIAIDTPGLRRTKSIHTNIDFYGLHRAQRSVRRADVVLLFFDAMQPHASGSVSSRRRAAWPPTRIWISTKSAPSSAASRSPVSTSSPWNSARASIRRARPPTISSRSPSMSCSASSPTARPERPDTSSGV